MPNGMCEQSTCVVWVTAYTSWVVLSFALYLYGKFWKYIILNYLEIHDIICRIPYNTHGLFDGQSLDIGLIYFGIHLDTFGLETFYYRIYLTECSLLRKKQ